MGITQVPPVPVPTAKGEIVVGTESGPTKLPVSTILNQSLVTDTTTATGIKWASTQRQWYGYFPQFAGATSGGQNPNNNNPVTKVIYGGGYYAYTSGAYVFYSTDGKNWSVTSQFSANLTTLAVNAAGTVWVVGGNTNSLWSAPNPAGTWTSRTSQMSGTGSINNIKWIPSYGLFVLTGGANAAPWNIITTSPDGATWTSRYSHGSGASAAGFAIANNLSTTTVVGFGNASVNSVYSTNGTSWTAVDSNAAATNNNNIIWLNNVGRFQVLGGSEFSQTPAAVGTTWGTTPTSSYRSMINTPANTGNQAAANLYAPNFDSVNNRWYALYGMSARSMAMVTLDDLSPVRGEFTATTNQYFHKIISIEQLPYYFADGATSAVSGLSYVNGQFFYINQSNFGHLIWTTIP